MIAPPAVPVVSRAAALSAIYLPPFCDAPESLTEEKMQVVAANAPTPMVTVLPPARRMAPGTSSLDRVVLVLDPKLLDRRATRAEAQEICDPYLFSIADTIRCGFRIGRYPPAAYLDSLFPAIAEHLREHYPVGRRHRERHGLSQGRLARALALIEERLSEPLAVNDIAAAVHLSPFHFARMFRRSTGLSPHEFITRQRLERAKLLLARSEHSMLEVAHIVGYRTQAHFTRVFHEGTGTTPRRYRRDQRAQAGGRAP
jgi:AraC family transcriptional regulator